MIAVKILLPPGSAEDRLDRCGQLILLCLRRIEIFAEGGVVSLDLGLCAGRSDHDLGAVLEYEGQNVCLRKAGRLGLRIVRNGSNCLAAECCRRVLSQTLHDSCHLVHAGEAGELDGIDLVEVTAVLSVDRLKAFLDAGADAAIVSSHLADKHGADGV